MRHELERFLNSLISQYGMGKVLLAPFGIMGALAGAGVVTGGAASLVATLSGLFVAVVVVSALSIQLRAAHMLLAERAAILNLYTDRFASSARQYAYTIENWEDEVFVSKGGTTILEKWVTIKVADQDLYTVWSGIYRAGMATPGVISDSERRRIKFEARSFNEKMELGARYDTTNKWEENWLWLFIHFDKPASAGQIVRVWLRWEWPGHYRGLLAGQTEPIDWRVQRPARRIAATVTFDKTCNLRNGLRITPYHDCQMPKQVMTPDGRTVITVEYFDVAPDSQVGFRLDSIPLSPN
jgi:hypothetical protein